MLYLSIQIETLQLKVWAIQEAEAFFESALQLDDPTLRGLQTLHPAARMGWLASRYLVADLTQTLPPPILKDGKKPYLSIPPHFVGISHTEQYAAVAIAHQNIGIDVQMLDEKLYKVAPRFMNAAELEAVTDTHRLEYLAVMWSAKEALYKMYNNRAIDYRKELLIEPFQYSPQGGTCIGYIPLPNQTTYRVRFTYQLINQNAVLVYGHE